MNFYLPDFYYHYKLNLNIVKLLQEYPEYFYDNVKIGGIYGSFPGAIWNGGRLCLGSTNLKQIQDTIKVFNNENIPLRFTFSNCLIDTIHLYDTYCNLIMECGNNGKNEVIINSLILENFLREHYPDYNYILSTTKENRDINAINNNCSKYSMQVLDYRDNKNFTLLNQIQDKSKIELLINAYCDPNCNQRTEHYKNLSLSQLTFNKVNFSFDNCLTCTRNFYDILEFNTVIKVDELYSTYQNLGFQNFKIEGRTSNIYDVIESYIYYLIKPQYQNKIRLYLLKSSIERK